MNHIPSAESLRRASEIVREIELLSGEMVALFRGGETGAPRRRGPGARKGRGAVAGVSGRGSGGKRHFSPAARARIVKAVKARWAKFRAAKARKAAGGAAGS